MPSAMLDTEDSEEQEIELLLKKITVSQQENKSLWQLVIYVTRESSLERGEKLASWEMDLETEGFFKKEIILWD